MKQSDFTQALTHLCDNGAIYSTYDNDIYSITCDWHQNWQQLMFQPFV